MYSVNKFCANRSLPKNWKENCANHATLFLQVTRHDWNGINLQEKNIVAPSFIAVISSSHVWSTRFCRVIDQCASFVVKRYRKCTENAPPTYVPTIYLGFESFLGINSGTHFCTDIVLKGEKNNNHIERREIETIVSRRSTVPTTEESRWRGDYTHTLIDLFFIN